MKEIGETLGDIVAFHAARIPEAVALNFEGRETAYGGLHREGDLWAAGLLAQGIAPGDRVAALARCTDSFVRLMVGAARAGIVLVPINWRLAPAEVAHQLDDSGAVALLYDADLADLAGSSVAAAIGGPHLLPLEGVGYRPEWVPAEADAPDVSVAPTDVTLILYTSGTTGRPKGVLLTHRNLEAVNRRRASVVWDSWTEEDASLLIMPVAHVGGFSMILRTLFFGATGVLMREFEAGAVLNAIHTLGVSKMAVVPTMLMRLLDHPDAAETDFARIKLIFHGGAPIEPALLDRSAKVIGCGFSQGYGMTESAGVFVSRNPALADMTTQGEVLPGVELRIATPDGSALPPGMEGEVQIRGECIMQGYWNRPDERPFTEDGWLKTGDIALQNAEGHVYIRGRTKDIIVSGGENIHPVEVENAIFGHPAVAEVAVLGVPDPQWGETVKAVIVPKPGAAIDPAEIRDWTRARIGGFKVPRIVETIDTLPRNALGKVLKSELR